MEATLEEKRREVSGPKKPWPASIGSPHSAGPRQDHAAMETSQPPPLHPPPAAVIPAAGEQRETVTSQVAASAASAEATTTLPEGQSQQPRKETTHEPMADMGADTPLELEVDGT
jgi:hypothetical protein